MSKSIDWKKRAAELEAELRRVRAYAFDYGNATGECAGGYLQQRGLICHECCADDYRLGCPLVNATAPIDEVEEQDGAKRSTPKSKGRYTKEKRT